MVCTVCTMYSTYSQYVRYDDYSPSLLISRTVLYVCLLVFYLRLNNTVIDSYFVEAFLSWGSLTKQAFEFYFPYARVMFRRVRTAVVLYY